MYRILFILMLLCPLAVSAQTSRIMRTQDVVNALGYTPAQVSGSYTSGNILLGAGGGTIQDSANVAIALLPSTLELTSNITYTGGSGASPSLSALYWNGSATGTCTSTCHFFSLTAADSVLATSANEFFINHNVGAGATGSRVTLNATLNLNGTPSDTNQNYQTTAIVAQASVNAGGSSGTYMGALFGDNPNCRLINGATFWHQLVCTEEDVAIGTGASVNDLIGHQVVVTSSHVNAGARQNVGYILASQANTTPTGFTFLQDGAFDGFPTMGSAGGLFRCYTHANSGNCGTLGSGLDFSNYSAITGNILTGPGSNGSIDGSFNVNAKRLFLNIGQFTPSSTLPTTSALGVYINESVTGTCATGCAYNYLLVNSDNVNAGTNNIGSGWDFNHNFGGAAATGNRVTGVFNLLMNQTTGNTLTQGASYGALGVYATATANDNGTGTGSSQANSQMEAMNVVSQLKNGATNWAFLQAAEFDVAVATGASVRNKEGIAIVQLSTDAVQGVLLDDAILITNQAGAPGWTHGLSFGQSSGGWPFSSGATAIGCFNSCGTLTNVLDFSNATITGNFLKSPGINIAGAATGSTSTPNIDFVTCGTQCGFYSPASGQVGLTVANTLKFEYGINNSGRFTVYASMESNNAAGWLLSSNAASSTAPTLIPNEASTNTGIGAQASGNLSMIVAGSEVARFVAGGEILVSAAPTVGASQVGIGGTTSAASSCGSIAGAAGCLVINVGGTTRNVPYF